MKTYLFKSTITGELLPVPAASLPLATTGARAYFGNDAFTWEGTK